MAQMTIKRFGVMSASRLRGSSFLMRFCSISSFP